MHSNLRARHNETRKQALLLPRFFALFFILLNSIRERLEMLCGGSLVIAPVEEGGTVVTLLIPEPPLK